MANEYQDDKAFAFSNFLDVRDDVIDEAIFNHAYDIGWRAGYDAAIAATEEAEELVEEVGNAQAADSAVHGDEVITETVAS